MCQKSGCDCCQGEPGPRGLQGLPGTIMPANYYQIKVSVSSAQTLTGNSVPILAIAAPLSTQAIRVLRSSCRLNCGTITYAGATTWLLITDTANNDQQRVSLITATVSTHRVFVTQPFAGVTDTIIIAGKAVYIKAASANPTLGNGTFDFYITYEIVDL